MLYVLHDRSDIKGNLSTIVSNRVLPAVNLKLDCKHIRADITH